MRFAKLHGLGNDFILIDRLADPAITADFESLARDWCDRRRGIGADGVLLLEPGERAPYRMRMWNPDGSESAMCGNGTRCVGQYLFTRLVDSDHFALELVDRVIQIRRSVRGVTVEMGRAQFQWGPRDVGGWSGYAVELGNPHFVVFVEDVHAIDLAAEGPRLETHTEFPDRTNVHFVEVRGPEHLIQRTWERGAGATLACGSGACASAFAAHRAELVPAHVQVTLPGGDLWIHLEEGGYVEMTGPATFVFEGEGPD